MVQYACLYHQLLSLTNSQLCSRCVKLRSFYSCTFPRLDLNIFEITILSKFIPRVLVTRTMF